jgi:branched-chain amino acid transport system substrate-binding protein
MEVTTPWQEATQWLQVLGLALILIFATTVFVRGVTLAIRGRHQAVRFGVELLLVFTVLFLFSHHALRMAGVGQFIEPLEKAMAFLWWISLAFTINASLNRFVWTGVLSENGVRKVPKLLTDGAALLLYGCAVMVVMHYVYDKPITTILATSGAAAFIVGLSAQSTLREVFSGLSLNCRN